jgi:predicted P-loop ATPase
MSAGIKEHGESFSRSHKRELLRPIIARARLDRCAYKNNGELPKWGTAPYPLDEQRVTAHLNGRTGCGIGFINPGQSTTRLALFDLDAHKGETPFNVMLETANTLRAGLEAIGLRPTPFISSGGSGVHLWLFWDADQDAYSVRCALKGVLANAGLSDGTGGIAAGQVEVFPKQDCLNATGPGSDGNMAIIPFWNKSKPLVDEFGLGLAIAVLGSADSVVWQPSAPVRLVVNTAPEREQGEYTTPDPHDKIARALAAIAPLADDPSHTGSGATNYDTGLKVLFSVHEASGGSEEGFELYKQWEDLNPVNAGRRKSREAWEGCQDNKEGKRITRATLYGMANKCNPEWDAPTADGMPDNLPAPNAPAMLPAFKRTAAGEIKATKDNIVQALNRPDVCGFHFHHDSFRAETMLAENGTEGWRALKDTDHTEISLALERGGFQSISKEAIRDLVAYIAEGNTFDSAQHWLNSMVWDGKPRIERFLPNYFSSADTDYTRAVSMYLWTAMAGRVLQPGVKCDMVPTAVGAQGMRKSSAVAALVPADDFFTSIDLSGKAEDTARILRGKLVAELDELKGLSSRDAEYIKSFITRQHEEWIPKYREMTVRYLRRCVFFGTSNKDDFLADETGNRRWLPFRCGMCDPAAIARDREQLWAEAREQFKAHGVMYREAERLAEAEHGAFVEHDDWDIVIEKWLHDTEPFNSGFLEGNMVLSEALGLPKGQQTRAHSIRVKKALVRLGYKPTSPRVDGTKTRGFNRPALF